MIGLVSLVGALIQSAAAGPFVDHLLIDIAREHAPWRGAPLVFLSDATEGASCALAMAKFGTAAPRPYFEIDGQFVRNGADVWRFSGTKKGLSGSDQLTPFEIFARTNPTGFVLTTATSNTWGAQLLANWLGHAIAAGTHGSSNGSTDVSQLTFLFGVPSYLHLVEGVSINSLMPHAVAEGTFEGCTYVIVNRMRARAQLGCITALSGALP